MVSVCFNRCKNTNFIKSWDLEHFIQSWRGTQSRQATQWQLVEKMLFFRGAVSVCWGTFSNESFRGAFWKHATLDCSDLVSRWYNVTLVHTKLTLWVLTCFSLNWPDHTVHLQQPHRLPHPNPVKLEDGVEATVNAHWVLKFHDLPPWTPKNHWSQLESGKYPNTPY